MDTIDTAVYKMSYDPGDSVQKVDQLNTSVDRFVGTLEKSVTAEEKVDRARRTTSDGLDRLLAKYDPQIRAVEELNRVQQQLKRFEDEGIGSAAQRQTALDAATRSLGLQSEVLKPAADGWRNLWGLLGPATAATKENAAATGGLAEEHHRASSSTGWFRDVLHTIKAPLEAAGVGAGNLGAFSVAARVGVLGLAAAIAGSLAIAASGAAEQMEKLKNRLDRTLGGTSGEAGGRVFAGLQEDARKTGIEVGILSGLLEGAIRLQQSLAGQHTWKEILSPDAAVRASTAAADLGKTFATTLAGMMQLEKQGQDAIGSAVGAFQSSLTTTGKLTAESFGQISRASPEVGLALARAFNYRNMQEFEDALKNGLQPSAQRVFNMIIEMSPKVEASLKNITPGVTQSFDQVTNAWKELLAALGDTGIWNTVSGFIEGATSALRALTKAIDAVKSALPERMQEPVARSAGIGALGGGVAGATVGFFSPVPGGALIGGVGGVLIGAGIGAGIGIANVPASEQSFSMPSPSEGGLSFLQDRYNSNVQDIFGPIEDWGGYAAGGIKVVPPGYPNDSFNARMSLTSGERLLIVPPGKTLSDIIGGGNAINLGAFAGGGDITVGTDQINVGGQTLSILLDLSSQSFLQAIKTAVSSSPIQIVGGLSSGLPALQSGMTDLTVPANTLPPFAVDTSPAANIPGLIDMRLGMLGLSVAAMKNLTGDTADAGGASSLGLTRIVGAIIYSGTDVIRQISSSSNLIVQSVNVVAAHLGAIEAVQAAAEAARAASASSAGAASAIDLSTGLSSGGGGSRGGETAASLASAAQREYEAALKYNQQFTLANAQEAARLKAYYSIPANNPQAPTISSSGLPYASVGSTLTNYAAIPGVTGNPNVSQNPDPYGTNYAAGQEAAAASYDPSVFADYTYDFASGVNAVVPPGHPNDSYKKLIGLTSGERLIVQPPEEQNQRGGKSSGGGDVHLHGGVNITINAQDVQSFMGADTQRQIAATMTRRLHDAARLRQQ